MPARILCLICCLASTLCPRRAGAVENERVAAASSLFEDARALMVRKEYAAACGKFEQSELLDPQLGTQLHLASCYERVGKTASAWLKFRSAAELAAQRQDPREQVAHKRIAALEARLSTVRVRVSEPVAEGLRVECDGRVVQRAAWGEAKPLDPGKHTISASAPGRQPWSHELEVTAEKREIQAIVPVLEPLPVVRRIEPTAQQPAAANAVAVVVAEPDVTVEKPGGSWMPVTGYIAGGVGLVALGFGIFHGVNVQNLNDELAELCVSGEDSNSCEGPAELEEYQATQSMAEQSETLQAVFLVMGGVLLAGGITLIVLAPRSESPPSVSLQLGPGRAGLVLQGKLF